jgi:hypothetical protein
MTAHGNKKFSFTETPLIDSFTQGEHTFASVKSGLEFLSQNKETTSTINSDRAIAQAVIRWLPNTAAGVRPQVKSCGICDGQNGVRAGFLRVLRVPLSVLAMNRLCPLEHRDHTFELHSRHGCVCLFLFVLFCV